MRRCLRKHTPWPRALVALASTAVAVAGAAPAAAQDFSFHPPGDLIAGSGDGRADDVVYAPTMLFPTQQFPAFANSQVYMNGGYLGPGGGQCDAVNYSYPWRDNYCETRSWEMPLCPSGTGHQGQDIRGATCEKDVHPVVAAENGTITNVGSYSVYLTAADGTRFDYLHMSNVQVTVGQNVARGDVLGMVSNEFGGTPTTIHLHFNIRQNVVGVGTVYVPPYSSLVNAYQAFLDRPIDGALEEVSCDAVVGWAYDPDDRERVVDVPLVFDDSGVAHDVRADVYRGDLCENLGFCDHGFDVPPPYSLFDGASHAVDALRAGTSGSLAGSPLALQCATPELGGARRPLAAADYQRWGFSAFWDEPPVSPAAVTSVPAGAAFPSAPTVWRVEQGWFVVDGAVLRAATERSLRAWRLSPSDAEIHEPGELAIGAEWPARPLVVRDGDELFVLDVEGPSNGGTGGFGGAHVDDPIDASATEGCGCVTPGVAPRQGAWTALLLAGALLARRRR